MNSTSLSLISMAHHQLRQELVSNFPISTSPPSKSSHTWSRPPPSPHLKQCQHCLVIRYLKLWMTSVPKLLHVILFLNQAVCGGWHSCPRQWCQHRTCKWKQTCTHTQKKSSSTPFIDTTDGSAPKPTSCHWPSNPLPDYNPGCHSDSWVLQSQSSIS